jgi:hypothetical protein
MSTSQKTPHPKAATYVGTPGSWRSESPTIEFPPVRSGDTIEFPKVVLPPTPVVASKPRKPNRALRLLLAPFKIVLLVLIWLLKVIFWAVVTIVIIHVAVFLFGGHHGSTPTPGRSPVPYGA